MKTRFLIAIFASCLAAARLGYVQGRGGMEAVLASPPPPPRPEKVVKPEPPSIEEVSGALADLASGRRTVAEIAALLESLPTPALLALLDKEPPPDDGEKSRLTRLEAIYRAWFSRDPASAMTRAYRDAKGDAPNFLWSLLEHHWGTLYPAAAWDWMTQPEIDLAQINSNAVTSVATYYAERFPDEAFSAWKKLPVDTKLPPYAGECLCLTVATPEKRAAVLADLARQPAGPQREAGLKGVLALWTQNGTLEQSAAWLEAQTTLTDEEKRPLQRSIAAAAAPDDPAGALNWLMRSARPESLAEDMEAVVAEWVESSPNDCAAWLESLPASPAADYPLHAFITSVSQSDPASAFAWSRRVSGPKRQVLARMVWERWQKDRPVSASKFTAELTAEERQWLGR